MSGLFGLFIAANYALTSIILVELISLERFTNAYGLLLLVQGIANLIGPPLAGWITDLTGNYKLAFYLAGIFIACSGLFMMLLPARGKLRKYRAFRRRCQSSGEEDDEDDDDDEEDCGVVDIEKCLEKCKPPGIKSKTTEVSQCELHQSICNFLNKKTYFSSTNRHRNHLFPTTVIATA